METKVTIQWSIGYELANGIGNKTSTHI